MFVRVFVNVKLHLLLEIFFPLLFYHVHTVFHRRMLINYFLIKAYEVFFKEQSARSRLRTLISERQSLKGQWESHFQREGIRFPQSL